MDVTARKPYYVQWSHNTIIDRYTIIVNIYSKECTPARLSGQRHAIVPAPAVLGMGSSWLNS